MSTVNDSKLYSSVFGNGHSAGSLNDGLDQDFPWLLFFVSVSLVLSSHNMFKIIAAIFFWFSRSVEPHTLVRCGSREREREREKKNPQNPGGCVAQTNY